MKTLVTWTFRAIGVVNAALAGLVFSAEVSFVWTPVMTILTAMFGVSAVLFFRAPHSKRNIDNALVRTIRVALCMMFLVICMACMRAMRTEGFDYSLLAMSVETAITIALLVSMTHLREKYLGLGERAVLLAFVH